MREWPLQHAVVVRVRDVHPPGEVHGHVVGEEEVHLAWGAAAADQHLSVDSDSIG